MTERGWRQRRNPRSGRPTLDTIAFTLGFEHHNPRVAQQVAGELVDLYLEENVRSRTVQTAETSEFLTEEVRRLDAEAFRVDGSEQARALRGGAWGFSAGHARCAIRTLNVPWLTDDLVGFRVICALPIEATGTRDRAAQRRGRPRS